MFRSLTAIAATTFSSTAGVILDFLSPPRCPVCSRSTEQVQPRPLVPAICPECELLIAPRIAHECQKCGAPVLLPFDTTSGCAHCHTDRFDFRQVIRLGVYDGPLARLCLDLKQARGIHLANATAQLFWKREAAALLATQVDLVIPVPRHWTQRFPGRFHFPTLLAGRLARNLKADVDSHTLVKKRRTSPQSSLTPRQRRTNLKGAFRVRGAWAIKESRILLVDDVLTTGSTANECSKVLLAAGAKDVSVAVLARGLGR